MSPEDFEKLSDDELVNKLDDAALADRFENSDDWRLIREACDRLAQQAERELLRANPVTEPAKVIECQVAVKFCRNVLKGILSGIRSEGKLAFEEAKDRGMRIGPVSISFGK